MKETNDGFKLFGEWLNEVYEAVWKDDPDYINYETEENDPDYEEDNE